MFISMGGEKRRRPGGGGVIIQNVEYSVANKTVFWKPVKVYLVAMRRTLVIRDSSRVCAPRLDKGNP